MTLEKPATSASSAHRCLNCRCLGGPIPRPKQGMENKL